MIDNKNDNDAIRAIAGNEPRTDEEHSERVDIINRQAKTLGQQVVLNEDAMIVECAPDDAFSEPGLIDRTKISCAIYPGGKKLYRCLGVPFLEIDAPVIKSECKDGDFVITSTTAYRKLN